MKPLADELRSQVDAASGRLRAITDAEATVSRGAGKWTTKDILGHLIDSAANNHQRVVRAQLEEAYSGPGYAQEAWVAAQQYRDRSWTELVELWAALNRHLAYAIESVPPFRLQTRCTIGSNEPVTLEWLMQDYLRHLRHHLAQILDSRT